MTLSLQGSQLFLIILGIAGLALIVLGPRVSLSRQHHFAFAAIALLFVSNLPDLHGLTVNPITILSLSMILLVMQMSAYYSGSGINTTALYGLILIQVMVLSFALTTSAINQSILARGGIAGMMLGSVVLLEQIAAGSSRKLTRAEINVLLLWGVGLISSFWVTGIGILPDGLFITWLLYHIEGKANENQLDAPFVSLYGILLFSLLLLFTMGLGRPINQSDLSPIVFVFMGFLVIFFIFRAFRSRAMSLRLLNLFLLQELVIRALHLDPLAVGEESFPTLLRSLLFLSLMGLFVMIESEEGSPIHSGLLKGIYFERPRFTLGIFTVSLLFALFPGVHSSAIPLLAVPFVLTLLIIGLIWFSQLLFTCLSRAERSYRILRPSLSIWSTVVFVILWSAAMLVETYIN